MAERLVLGVDLGSSSAKAVLATESGRVVARASVPQHVDRPGPGLAEQDPERWWAALRSLVGATWGAASANERAGGLAGVTISAHFPTVVFADASGAPLLPALLYEDRRADAWVGAAGELAQRRLDGDEVLPKMLWLAAERPDVLALVGRVCTPKDWLALRLTGEQAMDHRTALRSGLFDPVTLDWRAGLAETLGLDPGALPPIRGAADVTGLVRAGPAAELGIPAGIPVLVGLADTPATLVGAGVVGAGDVMLYYGTTSTADVCTHDIDAYLRDASSIREWAPYREVAYAVLGPALPWVASGLESSVSSDALVSIEELDRAAGRLPLDPDGPYVLPRFLAHSSGGEPADRPAIVGLDVVHGRADLHRALLESFGFTARAGLEASGLGGDAGRFVAAGGGARSAEWRQIVSDVLGIEQSWTAGDGALGSAMITAWGACGRDVFGSDLGAWVGESGRTIPDADANEVESARYRTWLRLRDGIAAVWR